MGINILQVTPALNRGRVALRGAMGVALDTPVTSSFSVNFFTTTAEVFRFTTVFSVIDLHGDTVKAMDFGGEPGLFMELMFDPIAQVWFITATNAGRKVTTGGSSQTLVSQYPWETSIVPAPPTISLSSNNVNVTQTGSIVVTATTRAGAKITKVEFYRNSVLLTQDTSAPFSITDALSSADNGTIRYTAKVYDILGNMVTSDELVVGVNIPIIHTKSPNRFDSVTQAAYEAAIAGAPIGGKRLAAATALVDIFAPDQRLYIYKDTNLIVPIEYVGNLVVTDDGYDIYVQPAIDVESSNPLSAADLTQGTCWFEFQGGDDYARVITGTVGTESSAGELQFQENPTPGEGFTGVVKFVMPRLLDGLT